VRWPFFETKNCSGYLTRVLHALSLDERRAAWVNANYYHGDHLIASWVSKNIDELQTGKAKIICLGRDAEQVVKKVSREYIDGTPYYFVVHPQAARRFPSYDKLFRQALSELLSTDKITSKQVEK
jgi:hypothetical protein